MDLEKRKLFVSLKGTDPLNVLYNIILLDFFLHKWTQKKNQKIWVTPLEKDAYDTSLQRGSFEPTHLHGLISTFTVPTRYMKLEEAWDKEPLMSRLKTKPTKWFVRPAKIQISLGICPVWSESSLSAWEKLSSLATHWAHSEDSDQTGWMPRLICILLGAKVILLVLSQGGSFLWLAPMNVCTCALEESLTKEH